MTSSSISIASRMSYFFVCVWLMTSQHADARECTGISFPNVAYNGYCYATIGGVDPHTTNRGCEGNNWYSMPNGWSLADNSADSDAVGALYPWGTHVLVYGTANQYSGCASTTMYTGSYCGFVRYESGVYSTNTCSLRVLIKRRNTTIPTADPTTIPTADPTVDPTIDPTVDPTIDPTVDPTVDPTSNPTQPTANPTSRSANCDEREKIKYIDWYRLQNDVDNEDQIPYNNLTITFDQDSLELTFDIKLEYLGSATNDDIGKTYDLPTTYVIDFQPFEINGNLINEPGNCQNRLSSSFEGITDFTQFWGYSEYPYVENHIGSNTYLSYPPPSQYWTLSIEENTCSPIKYHGTFNWNDLAQCTDYDGNSLMNIAVSDDTITLSGTLYMSIVSPFYTPIPPASDSGFYNVFTVASKEFSLRVNKQSNILSDGINLFMASIIGINEDASGGSFELSVLTKSADYMELSNPSIMSSPYGTDIDIEEVTTSCLVTSSFTCGQIFTISINKSVIQCPPASFAGDYNMGFIVNCPDNDEACTSFIADNGGSAVALGVTSNFVDNDCESEMYDIIFDGVMSFYDDEAFETTHDEAYIVSKDPIYVQIEVNLPEDGSGDSLNIFGVQIDNVFVCTAGDDVDLSVNLNQQNGNGGCLSSEIDDDGPYDIIVNGVEDALYGSSIISNGDVESNMVQFSFLPFDLGRTRVYIHAQITLVLQNGRRRRLQVINPNNATTSNQIRHFMGSVFIEPAPTTTTTSAILVDNKENITTTKKQGGGEGDEDESDAAHKLPIFCKSVVSKISYLLLLLLLVFTLY